jgi:hypothetical protein
MIARPFEAGRWQEGRRLPGKRGGVNQALQQFR